MSVIIIGAGHAGLQVADSLRTEGYPGNITVIDEGNTLPYQRPPLSKDYLLPGKRAEPMPLRSESFFKDKKIVLLHACVVEIKRDLHQVKLADGRILPYGRLVLATGARSRELPWTGAQLRGLHVLRTLHDAEMLHAALPAARRVVVIGAGFIGLEFAAAAVRYGSHVTVLEAGTRPMARAVSPAVSNWFTAAHHKMGISLRLGEGVVKLKGDNRGQVSEVVSTTGVTYSADLVLAGIGVLPNDILASEAGLHTKNGIVVDEALRTSDPEILAVGDCANFPNFHTGTRTRLESVQNATDQARHAARTIVATSQPYTDLPWFWSVQGAHRLQIAGISSPGDIPVTIGKPASDKFSVLLFHESKLVAVESVNAPADHAAARRLLVAGTDLMPEEARAEGFSLQNFSKRAPVFAAATAK